MIAVPFPPSIALGALQEVDELIQTMLDTLVKEHGATEVARVLVATLIDEGDHSNAYLMISALVVDAADRAALLEQVSRSQALTDRCARLALARSGVTL